MGKKRRGRHRIPIEHLRLTDPVTPEYQAQVDRSTTRLEREFAAATRRVAKAEDQVRRALAATGQSRKSRQRDIARAQAAVELRRAELAKYESLMMASDFAARHRGRDSYRPVPVTHSTGLRS